jgi:hypothetical protein
MDPKQIWGFFVEVNGGEVCVHFVTEIHFFRLCVINQTNYTTLFIEKFHVKIMAVQTVGAIVAFDSLIH